MCFICKFKFFNYKEVYIRWNKHCSSFIHLKNCDKEKSNFDLVKNIFSDFNFKISKEKSLFNINSNNSNLNKKNLINSLTKIISSNDKEIVKNETKVLKEKRKYQKKVTKNVLRHSNDICQCRYTRSRKIKCKEFYKFKRFLSEKDGLKYFMNYQSTNRKNFIL